MILGPGLQPDWVSAVRDSKELSPARRRQLGEAIRGSGVDWALGWTAAEEIDRLGIRSATHLAMRRALAALAALPEFVLVDGNDDYRFPCPSEDVVRGDAKIVSVAAASVLAKVARDAWMTALADRVAGYGFAAHKGYPTPAHLEALRRLGPCAEHRRSYAPVRAHLASAR